VGAADEKPIMDVEKHPFFDVLYRVYGGEAELSALVLFETAEGDESELDQCALPEQKELWRCLVSFISFAVLSRQQ
jgi:hypothetical protein